ncbi:SDR family oxidoreductase [Yinghuangia aomiensis]
MVATALIIGASGRIGSQVVKELDSDNAGIAVRLATSRPETADRWRAEGREAVVLDLNRPEHFAEALEGVDRVFLLTGYLRGHALSEQNAGRCRCKGRRNIT